MIPSYFIDDASLFHGTSSVNMTGGGLGGLVKLATVPAHQQGFGVQYVQGIGSFSTFDEFLRLSYGDKHWQISTRAVYQSSPNDYKYRNHDKKEMFMMMNTISLSNIIRLNVIEVVHLKTYTYYRKYITMQVMVIALA